MMKRIVTLLLLVITTTVFSQKKTVINAMSFNIRYDNPKDGDQNWHHRKENVIRMLNFYDVDIVGMQEVLVTQLDYIKENLPNFEYVGIGRKDGIDKGEFSPIFYKKDRFKMLKSETFWLSETPDKISKGWDANLERIATWAILKEKRTNKEIFVINTHFDHRGVKARVESARLLRDKIAELAGGRQVILTGDFNSIPDSEAVQLLTNNKDKKSLKDAKAEATHVYGPDWTSTGFDPSRPFENRKIIDYIFLKGISKVHRYAVLSEKLNDIYLSDHTPVFVQLEL